MTDKAPVVKPTIVFVHGAWHTADCWSLVTTQLKKYGYSSQAIQLPSAGGDLATTVEDDAAHIRKTTSELVAAGKDVILVLHSYGGISGTESAKGLLKKDREAELKKGGINSIVYVAAFLLPLDASLKSFLGDLAPWIIFEGEKMTIINADRIFYNDLPESGMDTLISSLKHQSKASFFTPLTYAAYQDVPVSYLLCENDNAIPFQAQQAMVGIGGPNVASHICAAGHMPMIQMPERVVNVIREAAGEVVA